MDKSRVETAVQELPTRSGRGKSDVSSIRSLDNLFRKPNLVESAPAPESAASEGTNTQSDSSGSVGADDVLFDDVVIDEALFEDVVIDETDFQAASPEVSDTELQSVRQGGSFADALLEELVRELRGPLSAALGEAERVLVEPERVATWFENQARRRLLSLAGKFADELRATEVKRLSSRPPGSKD